MDKIIPRKNEVTPINAVEILSNARRLIVLVPDFVIDEIALGRKLWDLALSTGSDILFLGTVQDLDEEWHTLHRIASLFAVAQDMHIHIDSHLEFGCSWQKAIRRVWQPGDVILCLEDHAVRGRLFSRKPLAREVAHALELPVYCLPGSFESRVRPDSASRLFIEKITRFH
jgi:hypothetical protein